MAGFSTSMPTSFKTELPRALHDFTNTTGQTFDAFMNDAQLVAGAFIEAVTE